MLDHPRQYLGRLPRSRIQLHSSSERLGLRGTTLPRRSQRLHRRLIRSRTPERLWTWAPPSWAETRTTITVRMDRITATSLLIVLRLRFMPRQGEGHLWDIFSAEIKFDSCKRNQRCLYGLVECLLQQFIAFNSQGVRRLAFAWINVCAVPSRGCFF